MTRTRLSAAAAATLAAVLVATMHVAQAAGVLRIGTNEDSTTFDPIKTIQNADIWVMNNMHAFLVRANREANEIIPDLAESWEISDDGLEYTFHLREAKFSDGSPVTAQDAVFSLTRLRDDPESVQSAMYQIMDRHQRARTIAPWSSRCPSRRRRSWRRSPCSPRRSCPRQAVTELGEEFGTKPGRRRRLSPEGVAPRRDGRARAQRALLGRGPAQARWGRMARGCRRQHPDPQGPGGRARCRDLHPVQSRRRVRGAIRNINVHLDPSTREDHLLLNHENEWLGNKNVRKALNMAIDIKSIVDVVTFGYGTPANSYIPAGALYYNPDNPNYPYDPEKAKAMLEAEGATDISWTQSSPPATRSTSRSRCCSRTSWARSASISTSRKSTRARPGTCSSPVTTTSRSRYWTNDIIDPDQKSTFSLGMDENLNY